MADLAFLAPVAERLPPVKAETAAAAAAARPATDFRLGATVGVSGALLVAVAHRRPLQRRLKAGLKIVRQAEDAEAGVVQEDSEAEQIFREAYEAEAERAALMSKQLEAALAEQLGAPAGITINIEAPAAPSPNETGGTTWRKAYEDIKARAASLESQLQKARRLSEPVEPKETEAAKAEANFSSDTAASSTTQTTQTNVPPPQGMQGGPQVDLMQQMQKLREIATISADEESVQRLLTLALLANQEGMFQEQGQAVTKELPALNQAREALSNEDFVASDALVFERCYVFPGMIPSGRDPAAALESLQRRMQSVASGSETELFLQPQKEEGKSLLIMVHKSDLPDNKMEAWQWLLWAVLLGGTFFSCLGTPLAVLPVGPSAGQDFTQDRKSVV